MSLPDETVGTVLMTLSCWILLHLCHPTSLMFSAVSRAAETFTGDPSLGEDSDEGDLLTGDLDRVELPDSSISLLLLTGVLDLLGGVWESLVLDVEGDLSTTLLSTEGLSWLSGTGMTVSMRHCINVIIDMKSRRLAWLIRLGSDGNNTTILRQYHWILS